MTILRSIKVAFSDPGGTGGGWRWASLPNTAGAVLVDKGAATEPGFVSVSGDGTLSATGALTVTKTNGSAFAASATTDTTNAANISSGTLPNARLDAELQAIAGLTSAADKGIYFTGVAAAATYDLTSFARTLLADTSASAARTTLGLAIGTDVQAYSAKLGDIAGLSLSQGDVLYWNGPHITNLGAGTSGQFLKTQGASANPVWATISGGGDMLSTNNLSDVASASTARTNLGLAIGTNVEAYSAKLDAVAALASAAGHLTNNGSGALSWTPIPVGRIKAWVSFNGTGTIAIRESGNVSSLTDNGTGDYTINFTSSLASSDYAAFTTAGSSSAQADRIASTPSSQAPTTTSTRMNVQSDAGSTQDVDYVYFMAVQA